MWATKQTRQAIAFFPSRIPFGQHKIVDPYDRSYIFPLYLYPETQVEIDMGMVRQPNLTSAFIQDFSTRLNLKFVPDGKEDNEQTVGPEDIFNYLYALFYSPIYRSRYAEFLKIDFPRLPITSNPSLFWSLSNLGRYLLQLHLMEISVPEIVFYPVAGNDKVEKVGYREPGEQSELGQVWINKTQYFEGVSPPVWTFYIGGYQVCEKWLKDRKGRQLTYNDIDNYQKMISAVAITLSVMDEIDYEISESGGYPLK
ncbi:type ISP restriction/modification enzyme [Laspinema olomoucense]|uniref:type ISP restriction/modification enzyme n=1 Tax=Laspinema olomoucense TaxID=3231600 RepID=UPI0021BA8B02|nr:type ISP restriction/modification enzyme [Laspinema sp. D3a]MCT7991864.1 hypothetical protein [Laspinema sp. D3a]